jgi:ubiquinone/menaquinone biosynthesis C-methylase UbiE
MNPATILPKAFSSWHEVWNRRADGAALELSLRDLLNIDGYDSPSAQVTLNSWLAFVAGVAARLRVGPGSMVCEVGCGAGAFLLPLYERGVRVAGVDYAENLIDVCKRTMPDGDFAVGEASAVPFPPASFDAVVSCGVFNYFPDLAYARAAIREIARNLKPGGWSAILDVNDAALRAEYESVKKNALGELEYEDRYANHRHLFIDRQWFQDVARELGLDCSIEAQTIPGYANSAFRFNVFLSK